MSVVEWLEMQWARFNIWLDLMKENPRRRYMVSPGKEPGQWIIGESARTPEEREVMQKARDVKAERARRKRELMTPEQRAAADERRRRVLEEARQGLEERERRKG